MNQKFIKDYYRMTGNAWKGSLRNYLSLALHHNLRYVYFFRQYEHRPSGLFRLLLHRMTLKFGLEISPKANIGEGFYLGHPYNITIAEDAQIGRNVNIHKGCTIGRERRGKRMGVPTIGNHVWIGINAVIVGNVTVGDDVLIAPGSFVNQDIPSHSVVVGNPCTIHKRDDATYGYVNFTN